MTMLRDVIPSEAKKQVKIGVMKKKLLEKIRNIILDLFKEKTVLIIVFGSYVKGDWTESSDIDILAIVKEPEKGLKRYKKIFDMFDEELMGKVDITILNETILKKPRGIIFDAIDTGEVIFDKNDFFKKLKNKLTDLKLKKVIEKKYCSGFPYWRINNAQEISRGLY